MAQSRDIILKKQARRDTRRANSNSYRKGGSTYVGPKSQFSYARSAKPRGRYGSHDCMCPALLLYSPTRHSIQQEPEMPNLSPIHVVMPHSAGVPFAAVKHRSPDSIVHILYTHFARGMT